MPNKSELREIATIIDREEFKLVVLLVVPFVIGITVFMLCMVMIMAIFVLLAGPVIMLVGISKGGIIGGIMIVFGLGFTMMMLEKITGE